MGSFPIQYYQDRSKAVTLLADALQEGTLNLYLGAGASAGFGLPSWHELASACADARGVAHSLSAKSTAPELDSVMEEVERTCSGSEFLDVVQTALYSSGPLPQDPPVTPLLTAVGALLMGSRRGSVQNVVTYNFDSMLEWYLSLHGYHVRVVHKLPTLEGSEDVRVYHIHGFLPHHEAKTPRSDFLIFTLASIDRRLLAQNDPWRPLLSHRLRSGTALFVGLSDRSLKSESVRPFLMDAYDSVGKTRPIGVWLLVGDKDEEVERIAIARGVVPLFLGDKEEVPRLIRDVCQEAAAAVGLNM